MRKDFNGVVHFNLSVIERLMKYHINGGTIDQFYAFRPECHAIFAKTVDDTTISGFNPYQLG